MILVDASNESPDVLLWLHRAKDGHFFIERKPNRFGSSMEHFRVSEEFAMKVQAMGLSDAWFAMEKHCLGV
jgi:hypothetical protein